MMRTNILLIFFIVIIALYLFVILWGYNKYKAIITYSELGNNGRLGNQLFQIASVMGHASLHEYDYGFPYWKYSQYFEEKLPVCNRKFTKKIPESSPIKYEEIKEKSSIDIGGYRQSHHYFSHIRDKIEKQFKFKPEIVESIKYLLNPENKKILGIHYRLGDYKDNPNHMVCTPEYYLSGIEHFKSTRHIDEIVLFSDEPEEAKRLLNIDCKVFNSSIDIEDLVGLTLCDYLILSNSTFSWWGAYLMKNKSDSIYKYNVIAPTPWFNNEGESSKYNNDCDIYLPCWKLLDGKYGFEVRSNFENRIDYIDSLIQLSMPKEIVVDDDLGVPVFIVSMNESRLNNSYIELSKGGFNQVNHFKAVVGKEQNYDDLVKYGLISNNYDYLSPNVVSKSGTIGCLISHFIIYCWLSKTDYDYVFITEDDIKYIENGEICKKSVIRSLTHMSKDWLALHIGGCISDCKSFVKVKDKLHITKYTHCTHSYLISKHGIASITKYIPFTTGIDTFMITFFRLDHGDKDLWYTLFPHYYDQDIDKFSSTLRPKYMTSANVVYCT